jgi:succinyldiaminopimelate transaminase
VALARAADSPGYPTTAGTPELQSAVTDYLRRRWGVAASAVLPTTGSKELVALLPLLLELPGSGVVAVPALAYPTYEVGARLVGARVQRYSSVDELDPAASLVWVNSPANPHGAVLSPAELAELVGWARANDAFLASDECYLELGWDTQPVSVLHPSVAGESHDRLLALHSLSKRSNLAGYRAGFVAGDPTLLARLLDARRHVGLIPPAPVQAAMAAVLADDEHVEDQRARYRRRRSELTAAFAAAGFTVTASAGGLYLWVTRGEDCWASVGWLADRGILAAPGEFYGPAGARHVRVALTATDERVAAAAGRLA